MERIWLNAYPEGVPSEVDVTHYDALPDVFEESVARFADKPAFTNMGVTLDYRALDRLSARVGAWFQEEAGLAPGDRVAIMMPNLLQYPVVLFGALRAGLTVVNVNPLYTPRELRHQLNDSGATTIVVVENFAHVVQEVIADTRVRHVVISAMGDMLGGLKGTVVNLAVRHVKRLVPRWSLPGAVPLKKLLTHEGALRRVPAKREDIAFLQYTGGTTGLAKGAILTHGNMLANLAQASAWLKPSVREGEEVIITALPLYHIFALLANCLVFLQNGSRNVLITNPRDMPGFVKTLSGCRFTAITGVNTLFNGLLNTPGFEALDFSSLKLTLGGGMAVQRSVAERWQATTGCPLLEAYGLTETSPGVCINPISNDHFTGSIGLPLPSTEVSIRDDEGVEQPIGAVGELCVRGPQVTQGYWQRPEDTQAAFFPDEWFRTGDMARIDETGYVYIVDRLKDMIIVSGFNVYPNEVEEVLAAHPDILEAAVIGVPDPEQGERLRAYVVPRNDSLDRESIIAHCRRELTRYKVPQDIEFRGELPKSNVGKILRRVLRDEARTPGGTD